MTPLRIQLVHCGSAEHLADLEFLQRRGLPIPHQYASWPLHDTAAEWVWSRVLDNSGELRTVFAVELTRSRVMPWARIGRIERVGRTLHESAAPLIGPALVATAQAIPRLRRLDVRVFDECAERRCYLGESIVAAGGLLRTKRRNYSRTLWVNLLGSNQEFLAATSSRARREIRHFDRQPDASIRPIRDPVYLDRIRKLYKEGFRRTGSIAPPISIDGVLQDSDAGNSELLGVFWRPRRQPLDLVAFAWCRFHGDHVSYEAAAMERSDDLGSLAPGYALIQRLAEWGRARRALWMDLGGVPGPDSRDANARKGIAEFKRSFTKRELVIAAEYEVIPTSKFAAVGEKLIEAFDPRRR
jgi:hypothetical protein